MESFLRKGSGLFPSSRSPGQQQGQTDRGLSLRGSFGGFFLVMGACVKKGRAVLTTWLYLGSSVHLPVFMPHVLHAMREIFSQRSKLSFLIVVSALQSSRVSRPSLRSQLVCFGRLHPHFLFYKRVHSPGLADESTTQLGTGRGPEPVRDMAELLFQPRERNLLFVEVVKIVWLIQNVSGPWEKRLSKIRSTQNKASRSGGGGGTYKEWKYTIYQIYMCVIYMIYIIYICILCV